MHAKNDRYRIKRIDLFAFGIAYNDPQHGAQPLYNGNISETQWRTENTDNTLKWYRYDFDALNRLVGARDNTGNYNLGVYDGSGNLTGPVGYDKNGNVTDLTRKGHLDTGGTSFGNMDVLDYVYDSGNKVLRIDDSGSDAQGFRDGTNTNDDFEYDGNGNLKVDRNKGITSISYNHLNMVTLVDFGATGNIEMVYAADGTKLKKTASNGTVTEYANGYIYENNTLQFFDHPEGYVMPDNGGWRYVYQYKDQVGNIRLSYTDNNGTLEIVEENNYYPFGGKMRGYNSNVSSFGNSTAQRWKFGGKEQDDSLNGAMGTYDFGARIYDEWGVRWWNIDPLAEKFFEHSPYVYANNNPIFFVDPDGNEPIPGPFTGRVIKDRYGKLTAWRITSNQRYALGVQSAIASSANIVGTVVGLKDAFSQKEPDWVRDLNKKTLALTQTSVEGFGEFLKANKAFVGANVIPNMSKVANGLNAVGVGLAALDYEATAQEKLESYTFQFAEGLIDFSGISGSNPGLLVVTPEAGRTVEGLENSLNTIYLGISLLTQDFDLSTDEGTAEATKYLQENQKIVVQFIKFLQQQNRKLEEQEQNEEQ